MFRRLALIGAATAFLAGCSSPVGGGPTNKDQGYHQKISRILIATAFRGQLLTARQANVFIRPAELQKSLTAKWSPLGITWQTVDLDAVTDKPKALADAIASFNPTQVLELKTTIYALVGGGIFEVVDGYNVDASLVDLATKKRVWRSVIEFRPFARGGRGRTGPAAMALSHQDDADDLIDTLTAKLKADGLL